VLYPGLLANAKHTAVVTITNSLGHGISLTNSFDTFSQTNYMVEAEDSTMTADNLSWIGARTRIQDWSNDQY